MQPEEQKRGQAAAPTGWSPSVLALALGVLVVVLAVTFLNQRAALLASGQPDLRLYLAAARILSGPHPELLYDWAEQQRQQLNWAGPPSPYVNPPFVALLFVPLLSVSRLTALTLTAVAEAAVLAAAMALASRLIRRDGSVVALAPLAHPVTLLIWFSVQPAPLVTLAWAGFTLAWTRARGTAAIGWLLLGLAVKPHLMLPLVVFAAAAAVPSPPQAWARRGLLVGGILALALVAWAMVGTPGLERYPEMLRMVARSGHWAVHAAAMPGLRGLLARALGDNRWSRGVALAAGAAVLAAVAWLARATQRDAAGRAAAVLGVMAGTLAGGYHLHLQELNGLFLLPPLAAAAGWIPTERVTLWTVGLVAALWALFFLPPVAFGVIPLALLPLLVIALRRCGERPEPEPI